MAKKRFVEAIVRTTVTERAIITYGLDGSVEEYETKDNTKIESVEEIKVLYEDEIDDIEDDDLVELRLHKYGAQQLSDVIQRALSETLFKDEHMLLSNISFKIKTNKDDKFIKLSQAELYAILYNIRKYKPEWVKSYNEFKATIIPAILSLMTLEYRSKFWDYDEETGLYIQPYVKEDEK